MTGRDSPAPAEAAELADLIVAAVTSCPGVAGLTQIPGIPVATYLPGRTISGVAVRAGEVEVCVVARYGPPLPQLAEQIRQAVAPLVPDRVVDVVIGDIALPEAEPDAEGGVGLDTEAGLPSGRGHRAAPSAGAGRESRARRRTGGDAAALKRNDAAGPQKEDKREEPANG